MKGLSKNQIDKLGNAIIFLTEKIPGLSKTKLIRLLYIIEEQSVITLNRPFFDLEFQVWQAGPVPREIFVDLSNDEADIKPLLLGEYIGISVDGQNNRYIKAIRQFSDDEFSDNEIELLENIADKFGKKTAGELVNYLHRPNTLWYKLAKEHDLLRLFESKSVNSSDVEIELVKLIEGCPQKVGYYNEQKEFNKFVNFINNTSTSVYANA